MEALRRHVPGAAPGMNTVIENSMKKLAQFIRRSHAPILRAVLCMLGLYSCGAYAETPAGPPAVAAAELAAPAAWAWHGQITHVAQKHARFSSPYQGQNSLSPNGRVEETSDLTLYAERRGTLA